MKRIGMICIALVLATGSGLAQDFISRGKIEFEIKRNNKRIYEDVDKANNAWVGTLPEVEVSYRELIFAWNRMLYQPGRKSTTPSFRINENTVFTDLDEKKIVLRQEQLQENYVFEDSLRPVKWRIENETRKIAGFECRKAVGRIFDSVYVVAFYCPEILPQGGPECFIGLPGMILGLAIPRFHTTWFATRIEIANIDESKIVPPVPKKSKTYSKKELADLLYKKYKDLGWWKDITPEKVVAMLSNYIL